MRCMSVCLTISEDRMKLLFVHPGLLLLILLKETKSVYDIITSHGQENNNEKLSEISDDTTVLGKAVDYDKAITYQELRNMIHAHKRNKMKRKKLKRKFKHRKQNRQEDNIFVNFSFLTKLS